MGDIPVLCNTMHTIKPVKTASLQAGMKWLTANLTGEGYKQVTQESTKKAQGLYAAASFRCIREYNYIHGVLHHKVRVENHVLLGTTAVWTHPEAA